MSPYIITTKRPEYDDKWQRVPGGRIVFRRAVATLEEARLMAGKDLLAAAMQADNPLPGLTVEAITESGGTVGPLPDGTLIEVKPRKRAELYRDLPPIVRARFGSWANTTDEQVCSAWNTNYAREAGHGR